MLNTKIYKVKLKNDHAKAKVFLKISCISINIMA
jgi:ribosome-binding factor A